MKDICDCDVVDKEKLALFRSKIRAWQDILTGNDLYSIANQIQELIWNDTVYRTFNEARRVSEEIKDPKTGLAGTLIELTDLAFFNSQIMSIRRLIDDYEWRPEKAVYSLPSLITEIEQNQDFYSRENYVCYDGLPYDGQNLTYPEKDKHFVRHETFDKLSGVLPDDRQRSDKITLILFSEIKNLLGKTMLIKSYSNKFIAHAAAPGNRRKIEPQLQSLSLKYLEEAYEAIIEMSKHIGRLVDSYIFTGLAVPQFDQFENWDRPMIKGTDKLKLREFWNLRARLFETWDTTK